MYADWIACGVKQLRPTAAHCAAVGGVVPDATNW